MWHSIGYGKTLGNDIALQRHGRRYDVTWDGKWQLGYLWSNDFSLMCQYLEDE
jgi:hypothetical protein